MLFLSNKPISVDAAGKRASARLPDFLLKGGDPVAPSGTTTLLRLHPSHRPRLRPPLRASGVNDFRGVTGGVYKARERIHRSMLTCDY